MGPENITETGIRPDYRCQDADIIWPTYEGSDTGPQPKWEVLSAYTLTRKTYPSDTELLIGARRYLPEATLVTRTFQIGRLELPIPQERYSIVTAWTDDNPLRRPFARLDIDDAPWRDLLHSDVDSAKAWYADADLQDWEPARLTSAHHLLP